MVPSTDFLMVVGWAGGSAAMHIQSTGDAARTEGGGAIKDFTGSIFPLAVWLREGNFCLEQWWIRQEGLGISSLIYFPHTGSGYLEFVVHGGNHCLLP